MSEMRKIDCFGYNVRTCKCVPLKELYCDRENCSFYKPKSEVNGKEIARQIKEYANLYS